MASRFVVREGPTLFKLIAPCFLINRQLLGRLWYTEGILNIGRKFSLILLKLQTCKMGCHREGFYLGWSLLRKFLFSSVLIGLQQIFHHKGG